MGDEEQRDAARDEELLHPLDGVHVEMIGRFVEQEDVGLAHEGAGEQRLTLASSRGARERHVGVEAEMLKHRLDARVHLPGVGRIERVVQSVELAKRGVAVIGGHAMAGAMITGEQISSVAQARRHDVEGGAGDVLRNVLLEPGDGQACLTNDLAVIGPDRPVEELHDGALAGAVAAQETDALAAVDRERGVSEDGRAAEGKGDVLHAEKCHDAISRRAGSSRQND